MGSMNRLSTAERVQIISCLVEGNSINSTVRMTGRSKHTVLNLLVDIVYGYLDPRISYRRSAS